MLVPANSSHLNVAKIQRIMLAKMFPILYSNFFCFLVRYFTYFFLLFFLLSFHFPFSPPSELLSSPSFIIPLFPCSLSLPSLPFSPSLSLPLPPSPSLPPFLSPCPPGLGPRHYTVHLRAVLLLQFMEHLDKLMYNAYEGSCVTLPPVPKVPWCVCV